MKKLFIFICLIISFQSIHAEEKPVGMINPWTNCKKDFNCAIEQSGVNFLNSGFNIQAMDNLFEINYPISNNRMVTIRKSNFKDDGAKDISGVYTYFSMNGSVTLDNTYKIKTRGDNSKIFVANFELNNANYSIYCKEGLSLEELEKIHSIILELNSI